MHRRDFLRAALVSVLPGYLNGQEARPLLTDQEFYERHMRALKIKAQSPPYNISADNVHFVTPGDMQRIAGEIRDVYRGLDPAMMEYRVKQWQRGFLKYLYIKAGYGSKPADTLPLIPKGMLENKTPEEIEALRKAMQEISVKPMDEQFLHRMVDLTLATLDQKNAGMMAALSGGAMDMVSNAFASGGTTGAVLIGDDGLQPDGEFICTNLNLDPATISPALLRMAYLAEFKNHHEEGHYRLWRYGLGSREDLADTFGGIKYKVLYGDADGAILLVKNFRAASYVIGDLNNYFRYGGAVDALDKVLKLPVVAEMSDEKILAKVKEEPAAPKSLVAQMGEAALLFKMRISVYERACRIAEKNAQKSALFGFQTQLHYSRVVHETALHYANGGNAESFAATSLPQRLSSAGHALLVSPRLNAGILRNALKEAQPAFAEGGADRRMAADAATALDNFIDPARAYNLKPNIVPGRALKSAGLVPGIQ
ncbi:MAG: hypothetical protein IT558_05905 [Alphaproteobacteria bacterium]|nr:hypothetical protein [Alphaproteobacteria bacterium]